MIWLTLGSLRMPLLLSQTWVCFPTHSKANLLIPGCGEGKCSIYCRAPRKESRQLAFKRPKLPEGFQEKVFKDRVREAGCGYVISLWTLFWLVDNDVIRSQHHQPSGSDWSRVCVLVNIIQLTSPNSGGFSICKTAQRTWLRILSIALEEELKVLNFV